jgi:uracil-DNA glycosylase
MSKLIPSVFTEMLDVADVSWQPILFAGLNAMAKADPTYLPILAKDEYLPTEGRVFAAFAQPLDAVQYVLVGEGPYPRAASATGVCFMDGAVGALWSESGLSKQVNRATSLRNFMKMLLVADGKLAPGKTSGDALAHIAHDARAEKSAYIQTLTELQANLTAQGFLLLNAALVFRPHVAVPKEAKAWQPFLQTVLLALADYAASKKTSPPTLVLWGKVAELLEALSPVDRFPKANAEHPYNLTFILNSTMHELFGPMHLLDRRAAK